MLFDNLTRLTDDERKLAESPDAMAAAETLAKKAASVNSSHTVDEYLSAAHFGLLRAAKNWKPDGASFRNFAVLHMRGAILDLIRAGYGNGMGMARKKAAMPRLFSLSAPIDHSAGEMYQDNGKPRSFADILPNGELPVGWEAESEDAIRAFTRRMLDRDSQIFIAFFLRADFATLREVAAHFGITESRVSQIIANECRRAGGKEGGTLKFRKTRTELDVTRREIAARYHKRKSQREKAKNVQVEQNSEKPA